MNYCKCHIVRFLLVVFLCIMTLAANVLNAQVPLSGTVRDAATGEPLPGATVFIPDLKTGMATGKDGRYQFNSLPKSTLLVQASYIGYGAVTRMADLSKTQTLDFVLSEKAIEASEVVITGSGVSTDNSRSSISITPISKTDLVRSPSTNIIDAIAEVPGLSEITTGGDISKPVIRGLSYNHVVTLNEGVRQEGQQWGDEHGIEIDQFSADRIEVLKGPASLFYGSDAMGGVINILEPLHAPLNSIRGELISQYATNNRMTNNSFMLEGNHEGLLWRARASYKNAASYKSPTEYIFNSCYNELNYSAMLGINRRWGYSHLHFSHYHADIGMVEGVRDSITGQFLNAEGVPVSASEEKSRIPDLPFQHVTHNKVTSVSNLIFGNSQVRVNLGYQENDRQEFEESPDSPSLYMKLRTVTGDVKLTHLFAGSLEFVSGLSGMYQMNTNKGTEYLIPDYSLLDAGLFLYLKKTWQKWTWNGGIRADTRQVTGQSLYLDSLGHPAPSGDTLFPGFDSRFSAFSGSSGFTFSPNQDFNLKFNLGSGFRAPNIAELGSNGVHPGTLRYEIGNPALKAEQSIQADFEASVELDWLAITLSGYYNFIYDYIYQRNEGDETIEVDGTDMQVYRYVQGNSVLTGFEFEIDFHPVEALHFENSIDYVAGTNVTTGIPLPYIPALHTVHKIRWEFRTEGKSRWVKPYVELGGQFHARQDRIDTFETPTSGYFLVDASAGTRLRIGKQLCTVFISGKNLTNQSYFDHLNLLKVYGVHNPGWGLTAGVVIPFGIMEKGI